ncbi:hypothetical protein [Streptomyces sp. NPDC057694]|uniref:hypothetical protein n=1 Tax=Streptomyces sp. NPDC057694 TaxID=3346216 RepID=UPI0036B0F5C0
MNGYTTTTARPSGSCLRACAVGPGWHRLLGDLHEQLQAQDPGYQVGDLKEKLGAVRIQIIGGSDTARPQVQSLVADFEARSAVVCEICGAPVCRRRHNDAPSGWISQRRGVQVQLCAGDG